MARLFADENFPLPVVVELRHLGHDVLTIQEAGMGNQQMADEAVLAVATSQNRVVLTLNRKHFVRLHDVGAKHAGIVVCMFDPDFVGQANRVDEALRSGAEVPGHVLRVNRAAG